MNHTNCTCPICFPEKYAKMGDFDTKVWESDVPNYPKENYHIEIRAMDNIPMMIETKRLNYWIKCHHLNLAYILERTIDGHLYPGNYKSWAEDEFFFQTFILARREALDDLMRLDFKPADVVCYEEIMKYHDAEVKKHGLYGGQA